MNKTIIEKCLAELDKGGEADMSYIKGMLETMLAFLLEKEVKTSPGTSFVPNVHSPSPDSVVPEIPKDAIGLKTLPRPISPSDTSSAWKK